MKKTMLAVVVSASALTAGLYSLPKVIVKASDSKETGLLAGSVADSSGQSADNHAVGFSPEQLNVINRLRNSYLTAETKEKKLSFADSLAASFVRASKPDSAAYYWEIMAMLVPTPARWLVAGNGYYDAFGFAADAKKAARYGEKARAYYQRVLDNNPRALEAKAKMAMTYVTTSNPMQGIALLREVLAEDPKNEMALFNLGLLSIRSSQYDKAIARFEQIIAANPDHVQAHYYLGVCYVETGRKEEARKVFDWVQQRDSDPALQASVDEYLKKLN